MFHIYNKHDRVRVTDGEFKGTIWHIWTIQNGISELYHPTHKEKIFIGICHIEPDPLDALFADMEQQCRLKVLSQLEHLAIYGNDLN